MEELVSVIVPIYNVEKYLKKCVASIRNQTYKNLEIILVDDGSPDECPKMCDDFAKEDSRIKVIHRENGGLSAARNSGLEIATGKYIGFVDSDDYIHSKMYEVLVGHLEEKKADLVVCRVQDVFEIGEEQTLADEENVETMTNTEALKSVYGNWGTDMVVAWNKLYKREIFDGLRYNEGKVHEDEYMIHKVLYKVKKVVTTSQKMYYYQRGSASIMRVKKYSLQRLQGIEAIEDRIDVWENCGNKALVSLIYESYFNSLIISYYLVKQHYPKEKTIIKDLRTKFLRIYKTKGKNMDFTIKLRLKYNLYRISTKAYYIAHGGFDSKNLNRKKK